MSVLSTLHWLMPVAYVILTARWLSAMPTDRERGAGLMGALVALLFAGFWFAMWRLDHAVTRASQRHRPK
jgi:hypothetical protein